MEFRRNRVVAHRGIVGFNQRRCRFQRKSDALLVNGWIDTIDPHHLRMLAQSTAVMTRGEVCAFEAFGECEAASFEAVFSGIVPTELDPSFMTALSNAAVYEVPESLFEFKVVGPMHFEASKQSPRKLARQLHAIVREPTTVDAIIHDVSDFGLGIVSSSQFAVGDAIVIAINHLGRDILIRGTTRYSRKHAEIAGLYRTGLEVSELDRLEYAKWRMFTQSV